jgi:hypothetical protein
MANETPRFHLTTLDSVNDTLAYRSYKFGTADRELLDRLITQIAENHHHTGAASAGADTPPPAPQLVVQPTGGSIAANVAVSYRYALVDADRESIASLPATIYTPPPVLPPVNGPVLDRAQGVLMTGDYLYAVSAYTYDTIRETPISTAIRITLIEIAGVNVTLPSPPSGATGFNIYRKGPTDRELHYLLSVDIATVTYHDNGAAIFDPLRGLPTANTTSSSNSITVRPGVSLSGTWKVFRTYDPSHWDDTLVVWSGDAEVVDTGWSPQTGSPLAGGTALGAPPKIDLGRETIGSSPSATTPTSEVVEFTFAGPVEAGLGPWQWVNDFDRARVLNFRANLGRSATPGSQPVKVALERSWIGATAWSRYADSGGNALVSPIYPGESLGDRADVSGNEGSLLYPGDCLRPAVLQSGGAPHTDTDLVVSVQLAVKHGLDPPPEDITTLRTEYTANFPAPEVQRTQLWYAPQDGTLSHTVVSTSDSVPNWQIRLDIFVNDTIVYTSDPILLPDWGEYVFSPESEVSFFRSDSVQFRIASLTTATNPYCGAGLTSTLVGRNIWAPIDNLIWNSPGIT